VVWQTAWDTPEDASEFVAAASATMTDLAGAWHVLEVDVTESDLESPVLVLIADDAAALDQVMAATGVAASVP